MPILLRSRAATASPLPLVSTDEARMLGIPVHTAAYYRVRAGVFADAAAWHALTPWEKYQVRVHAFVSKRPDVVLCLESAAVLHGLPLFGEARQVHVYDPDRRMSRRVGDVSVHTSVDVREIVTVNGIRCTSMLATVVDLTRVLPLAEALAIADASVSARQGGPLDVGTLRRHGDDQTNPRGRARLAWLWPRVNGRAESPTESVSRAVIEWAGFETPELQRTFHYEGYKDRGDFYFPSCGVIGESDGWGKYDLDNPAKAERHLRNEKRREDRLRRHGHGMARWEHRDAMQVAPMCRALHAAGVPVVRPARPRMLATLNDARRRAPFSTPQREKPLSA